MCQVYHQQKQEYLSRCSHYELPIEGYLKNIIIKLYMLICYRAPPSSVVRDQLSTV